MSLNVAVALMIVCVLGVFSTIILVGLAFAVREHKQNKAEQKQEDTTEHE